ncbi:MAG: endopeptidase La [Candidatus Yanofskybacteria bacterium CG10_big_fil_rev_8_21_14_0_10_36_16]|uniref:Lon protease n=1 Tax=Candidatus Yanofskybacteria bacterium CG10_big_fil_rev_8_21_14_0_10_36_16 TaxID=1975096 RepID=A0A2J0QAX4_9BACT|nr:MAG: endopeptidase La [Candidatus Yanofskybacteria bacterium CG10_big_fil_rev_8_21_14_0_10_36_16]
MSIQKNKIHDLPLIALKNVILFPRIAMPLLVQRPKSIRALEYAMSKDKLVVFVGQKDPRDDVNEGNLFDVGTVGKIFEIHKMPDGTSRVDVEGIARVKIKNYSSTDPFFSAKVEDYKISLTKNVETQALMRTVADQLRKILGSKTVSGPISDVMVALSQVKDPEQLVYLAAMHLSLEIKDQQEILEAVDVMDALKKVNFYLNREIEILSTEQKVARETKRQLGKMQKEVFLREQLKSIEKELGLDGEKGEFEVLRQKISDAGMPKDIRDKAEKELGRLEKMPPFSPEVSYLRTYLDWLVDLPWSKKSKGKIDMKEADKILNNDHYGLKKAKERILEYLAVQKQVGKIKGPILCFVGPPGVGKTSIGKSIAKALDREFVRVSLGGLRDEAEIRGHRRTYVGALPGRIIQGINNAKTRNPVFMLDEIDKVGTDFRGDPSSALLEALDPEQNHSFSDHYLEVPFDLSDVLFITTANMLDTIPPALRDRLEIIEFPGYTEDEKLHIAKQFLVKKVLEEHGIKINNMSFTDGALKDIIRKHTREAGVRNLERQVAKVIRKITRKMIENKIKGKVKVDSKSIHSYLGAERYTHLEAEKKDEVGIATGLAWTPAGGEILFIESSKMPGKGKLTLTGHLGNVMKESVQTALSYARNKSSKMGSDDDFYKEDIHVHVPSGAIPKDGPSAGVAIAVSLISLLTGKKVFKDVGMTGEITLRGKVLEIGGLKEKILAAHRAGLKKVIVPAGNKKDLIEDVPSEIKKALDFKMVKDMNEVIKIAIQK